MRQLRSPSSSIRLSWWSSSLRPDYLGWRHGWRDMVGAFGVGFLAVLVPVFAGEAFHELHNLLPEVRLESPDHPGGRAADHHAGRDRDGQHGDSRLFVIHVARFAVALGREDVPERIGGERGPLERDDPGERQVLGELEGFGQLGARVPGLFLKALVEPAEEILDVLGDQQRSQAAGYAAERNVRDAQQPYCLQRAFRALEEVGAAPERAGRYRDEVGGEI